MGVSPATAVERLLEALGLEKRKSAEVQDLYSRAIVVPVVPLFPTVPARERFAGPAAEPGQAA